MAEDLSPLPATAMHNTHMSEHFSEDNCMAPVSNSSNKANAQVGPWRLGRTLGKGSSGKVRLAKHTITGQLAAVKIVPKTVYNVVNDSGKAPYGIEREIIIMKLIQHPNIMALYDVWENKGELYLVLEYIEGGELFNHLITKGRLDEAEAVNYFSQIIYGVDYCHRFNICHRDLKPENLLLDKYKNIKIADFGMAALETSGRMLETSCGSPHYASPEIVAGKTYHGAPSDIWSCGIILFAFLTAHLPFDDDDIRLLLFKVQQGKYTLPDYISENAKDLITKMLCVNPDDRITIPDILEHPLLTQYKIKTKSHRQHLPNSIDIDMLAQPISSENEIDPEILKNLQILWHGESRESMVQSLLSDEQNYEKTFYCLLMKYRNNHRNNGSTRKHDTRRCKSSSNKSRSRSLAHSRSRSRSRVRSSHTRSQKSCSKQKPHSSKTIPRETSPIPPLPLDAQSLSLKSRCIEITQSLSEFASMIEQTFDINTPTSIQYKNSTINGEDLQRSNDKNHEKKGPNILETHNQYQVKKLPVSTDLVSPPPTPLFSQAFEEDRFADAVEEEVDLHSKRRLERNESKHARKLFLETQPRREIKTVIPKRTRHTPSFLKPSSIDENHVTPSGYHSNIPKPDSSFVESQLHISELLKTETFQPRFNQVAQNRVPSTFTSRFGPDTKFTMTSSMKLTLPKPLETRHFNPNNLPIFDKPRVRMHNRTSEVSLDPSLSEVHEKPKLVLETPPTVNSPTPTLLSTSSPVSKSKNLLRKFALVSKRNPLPPPPPQNRIASNNTTSTQDFWSANRDTPFALPETVLHDKIKRQASIQPKQNWFMKILSSGRSETKGFHSPEAPAELRRTIILILSDWQRYGISSISEEESSCGYLIRAKVSSKNMLKMRSARFRIELSSMISGTAASPRSRHRDSNYGTFENTSIIVVRERGSSNSFLRFLGELERELENRDLLQPEGKLESVKTVRIFV